MTDEGEKLIALADVPRLPWLPARRGGKKIAVQTVYRWSLHGCRGIKLQTVSCGGTRCTTVSLLKQFFADLAAQSGVGQAEAAPAIRTPAARTRGHNAAMKRLARRGVAAK